MRSRGMMTTTSSKTERARTHYSRVWLVSSAVPYGRTPAVFVICKMQKLKEKKKSICNLFRVLFIFTATAVVAGVSRSAAVSSSSSSSGRWCGRWTVKSAVWSPLRPYPSLARCPVQSGVAALVEKCVVAFPRSTRYTRIYTHTHKHRMHLMHWPT